MKFGKFLFQFFWYIEVRPNDETTLINYEDIVISELGTEECSKILLSKTLSKNKNSKNYFDFKTGIGDAMRTMKWKNVEKKYPGLARSTAYRYKDERNVELNRKNRNLPPKEPKKKRSKTNLPPKV